MDLLVLDTIHGGKEIGSALAQKRHRVELVNVYQNKNTNGGIINKKPDYDRIIVPVHFDPDNSAIQQFSAVTKISHHEAVRWIPGDSTLGSFIEITSAQGTTTTAHALASILPGAGVFHTSNGTFRMPGKELLFRRSIIPVSVIPHATDAISVGERLLVLCRKNNPVRRVRVHSFMPGESGSGVRILKNEIWNKR